MSIFEPERRDDTLVVALRVKRLDASIAARFRTEVLALAGDVSAVVLDITEVQFIDSTGLGTFVAILKALPPSSRVRLVGVAPMVRKALDLTRLSRVFPDYPSVNLAIAA
jgi:anti-sigma B factor antagonist